MSREIWAAISQEICAQRLGLLPDDDGDPEPWLSYEAIAWLTKKSPDTIEGKATGLDRHELAPFIKLSHLRKKLAAEEKAKKKRPAKKKARRKRPPSS